MSDATYAAVEDALRAHVADEHGTLLTDWVVLTASVGAHPLETLYVDMCSETAGHSIEGLLQVFAGSLTGRTATTRTTMSDWHCMRWPLSLLCDFDDRGQHDEVHDWRCKLHDQALTLAYRFGWQAR